LKRKQTLMLFSDGGRQILTKKGRAKKGKGIQ
jgi:hypothetical protein